MDGWQGALNQRLTVVEDDDGIPSTESYDCSLSAGSLVAADSNGSWLCPHETNDTIEMTSCWIRCWNHLTSCWQYLCIICPGRRRSASQPVSCCRRRKSVVIKRTGHVYLRQFFMFFRRFYVFLLRSALSRISHTERVLCPAHSRIARKVKVGPKYRRAPSTVAACCGISGSISWGGGKF